MGEPGDMQYEEFWCEAEVDPRTHYDACSDGFSECGEPACARVWWDNSIPVYLCRAHFEAYQKDEAQS